MEKIKFFDCHCAVGRRMVKNPGSFHETDELLRKMELYGIDNAMVYHTMAKDYAPVIGNQMLMDEIIDHPNLKAVWVVLPHHTGEFPDPAELEKQLKLHNISAVRIFPSGHDHGFSLKDWCSGELLRMLEECRIPMMIGLNQLSSWDSLHDLLFDYPNLRVILTDLHYNCGRNLYPLFKKFEHLYVETIGFKVFDGIEDVCKRFGAERLIFGSCAPLYSGGAAVGMITYARITHEEKSKIASGNLEKLIGGISL